MNANPSSSSEGFGVEHRGPSPTPALLLLGAVVVALGLSLWLSRQVPERAFLQIDIWFNADILRVIRDLTEPGANHDRLSVHPLFSLLLMPFGLLLTGLGFSPKAASLLLVAGSGAGLMACLLFIFLRLGLRGWRAALAMAVVLSSASFLFWWSVPDTFPFGGLSIALVFALLASGISNRWAWVAGSALSLSITTTNWAAGLIATVISQRRRAAVLITAWALALVLLLSLVQKLLLPSAALFFLPSKLGAEKVYLARPSLPRALNWVMFTGVAAEPEPILLNKEDVSTGLTQPRTAVHSGAPISLLRSPLRLIASVCWLLLLAAGARAGWRAVGERSGGWRVVLAAGLFLAFQFCLHMIWGDEPFLYSAHFLPPMAVIIGCGLTAMRPAMARVLCLVFSVSALGANVQAFRAAVAIIANGS